MKNSFIKNALIVGATIFSVAGVAIFAQTNIDTNIFNAVQTIMRTVYTDDGSAGGNVLVDINNANGHFYISTDILAGPSIENSYLGLNEDNEVIVLSGGGGPGILSGDHDRYQVGTTQTPIDINDNIYTYGQVGIGLNSPTVPLQVSGSVIFGNTSNTISTYPTDRYASILGGKDNSITQNYSSVGGGLNNNIGGSEQSQYGFIGGGKTNYLEDAEESSIVGGTLNTIIGGGIGIIGGGYGNQIISSPGTVIGGGRNNVIQNFAGLSFIGGGEDNLIDGANNIIVGGKGNAATNTIDPATNPGDLESGASSIVGGRNNNLNGQVSSIVGGRNNLLQGRGNFIGGGKNNTLNGLYSNIVGGNNNTINYNGQYALDEEIFWRGGNTILGGGGNIVDGGIYNTILGGAGNQIYGGAADYDDPTGNLSRGQSTITYGAYNINLGDQNTTTGDGNIIIGGPLNYASGGRNLILGGLNSIIGDVSVIIGQRNTINPMIPQRDNYNYIFGATSSIEGHQSMAFGRNAHAFTTGRNLMVFNLDSANIFTGYGSMSMLINAPQGVGINTNLVTEGIALDVNGNIKTQGTFVAPSNNQGITQTINLTDSQSNPCTLTVEAGIVTATTCQ